MKTKTFAVAAIAVIFFSTFSIVCQAQSTVSLKSGTPLRGDITSVSKDSITIETRNGVKEVAVGDLRTVKLDGEPSWLSSAKARYRESRFDTCYESLSSNKFDGNSALLSKEIDFYKAMAAGQLAIAGSEISMKQAGSLLLAFLNGNTDSFRYYDAAEMFADLAADSGSFKTASEYYTELIESNSAELKSRSLLKRGKALLFQKEYSSALEDFKGVRDDATDSLTKQIAACLMAQCMAYTGQADEAIEILNDIVKKESSDQRELFARAYNALGCCYIQQEKWVAARIALMHTKLMFSSERDAFVECLYHLNVVCKKLGDSQRTTETRQLLKTRFPNSFWTSQLDNNS